MFETSKGIEVVNSFDKMHLKELLLKGIYAYGEWCRTGLVN